VPDQSAQKISVQRRKKFVHNCGRQKMIRARVELPNPPLPSNMYRYRDEIYWRKKSSISQTYDGRRGDFCLAANCFLPFFMTLTWWILLDFFENVLPCTNFFTFFLSFVFCCCFVLFVCLFLFFFFLFFFPSTHLFSNGRPLKTIFSFQF